MDKQKNNHTRSYRLWVLALIIPILIFSGIHFFVTSQVRKLLPNLVNDISGGTYRLRYQNLKFNYFNPYMTLTGVHLQPVRASMDEEHDVKADTVLLSLESFIPFITNDAIHVREIRVVNPAVLSKRNVLRKDDKDPAELHAQVSRLQENAILFLNALSVRKCSIINGSFRYYPLPGRTGYFNLEHVDLTVTDLNIPAYSSKEQNRITAGIKVSILNPRLSIPDSLISVQLDRFDWDNQKHKMEIGKFSISQRSVQAISDSFQIQLDTIRIRNIDWPVWLDSGMIKLDTLLANSGSMYFESSATRQVRKSRRDTVDIKKMEFWDAIGKLEVDHFSARRIRASVINTKPGRERNNSLIGDSLVVRALSIRPERANPLRIGELELGVREFRDEGSGNQYKSSFSRMLVKGNSITLNNYLIRSTSKSKLGEGASLFIPALHIEGISLSDLLDRKASIREIRMEDPDLFMYSIKGKGEGRSRKFPELEELKPYVDVERVVLNHARVTVRDRNDTSSSMGTREFSAVIMARSAMKAPDMEGLLQSFTNVSMKDFFFLTRRTQLRLFDGQVDYRKKSLRFKRAEGYLNHRRIKAELNDVEVTGAEDVRPFGQDVVWHFSRINVNSGNLDISLDTVIQADVEQDPDKLIGLVDTLDLSRLVVSYRNSRLKGSALVNRAKVAGYHVYPRKYHWASTRIEADDVSIEGKKMAVSAATASLLSEGRSVLSNARILSGGEGTGVDIRVPELIFAGDFPYVDPGNLNLSELLLVKPDIRLEIRPGQKAEAIASRRSLLAAGSFRMEDPTIQISVVRPNEKLSLQTAGKFLGGEKLQWLREDTISTLDINNLRVALDDIKMRDDRSEIFRGGSLNADIALLRKPASGPPIMNISGFDLDSIHADRISAGDTLEINTGGISIGKVSNLYLQKDSILHEALKLPPARVLPGSITVRTPQKAFSILNASLNTAEQYLTWDSLAFVNRVPRDSFFARQPYEKDYITLHTGKLRMDDLRPEIFGRDTAVNIRKLTVDPFDMRVERDKRMPDDTISYRPLLAGMLKKLDFPLHIDTIELRNSRIWHNVIDEKTEKEGSIFFTELAGTITNAKNYDVTESDSLRVTLNTRIMDKGQLRFIYREGYADTSLGFLLSVRMGSMDMRELNRLITPLLNVRAEKGSIRDLSMKVKGNQTLAYGSMEMNYRNLRVSVLDEKNKRKGLVSWLANVFVRGQNNKTGIVYAERLREKSVFNYWARMALNGLLTNMGIRKNARQERRFYKKLEKSQLPAELF